MARKTRSVKGAVKYFKRPYVLNFKDGKPTVYKIQICRGRVIKDADLIAYAAQAANVPESTMITARHAILDAINYFVMNGHGVQLAGLGSFTPRIRAKAVNSEEEVKADTITAKYIKFNPAGDILNLANADNISFEEDKALSQLAMNDFAFRLRHYPNSNSEIVLVTEDGKVVEGEFETPGQMSYLYFDPTDSEAGWKPMDTDLDVEAYGVAEATITKVNKEVDGQVELDYYKVQVGNGELKLTAGGTLSPQPSYWYSEEGE